MLGTNFDEDNINAKYPVMQKLCNLARAMHICIPPVNFIAKTTRTKRFVISDDKDPFSTID